MGIIGFRNDFPIHTLYQKRTKNSKSTPLWDHYWSSYVLIKIIVSKIFNHLILHVFSKFAFNLPYFHKLEGKMC